MLPNLIPDKYMIELQHTTFCLLIALLFLAHRFGFWFHHTDEAIEKRFGLSRSSIKRGRKELQEKGFIEFRSGFKTKDLAQATRYTMIPNKEMREAFHISDGPKRAIKSGDP